MSIAENKVVTLHYTLTDDEGTVIDKSDDGSFLYLHGASNIIPGLENALTGKVSGDELKVTVSPEDGYGERDNTRQESVSREMFPTDAEIEAGMQFHAEGPEGEMMTVTVTGVEDDTVTIDGNHPLAGVQLNFDVKVIDIRDASAE
ncbi:MAG: peptidylprolyl isomerase, partial [Gammaproteobacteria bacterium]|nr:peptidylprolyl isomerase [Gammaproteobacteria bacterium]